MKTLDTQIARQVEGTYVITMHYNDRKPEHLTLFNQANGFFIKPLCMRPKPISQGQFIEIVGMCDDSSLEQVRESSGRCNMSYNDFWDKYYNYV